MLTIVAVPKAFRGRFDVIQRNALRSWARITPRPEIVLFGSDEGVAEAAREIGARHIPELATNQYGTPLVDHLWRSAQRAASHRMVCYVNSDIILPTSFALTVERVQASFRAEPFLAVGRKINLELPDLIDFHDPSWESNLQRIAQERGNFVTYDSDYFLFPRGLWREVPAFAIGRCYWSSWFVFDARRRHLPVVDLTRSVVALESKHDYSHAQSTGGSKRLSGVEFELNRRLFRGCRYYTTVNATHVLSRGGLRPAPLSNHALSLKARATYWVYFLLKGRLYPYSLPLILILRAVRISWQGAWRSANRLRIRLRRQRQLSA